MGRKLKLYVVLIGPTMVDLQLTLNQVINQSTPYNYFFDLQSPISRFFVINTIKLNPD